MLDLSLIGNPVKIGDGPAAVTPPLANHVLVKGTLLATVRHCRIWMGRLPKGRGSQKTCLNRWYNHRGLRFARRISRIKMGHPRID